jgi:hypothetical protein
LLDSLIALEQRFRARVERGVYDDSGRSMAEVKSRSHSMRPDGALVVDVKRLLASDRVKRDLEVLRQRINAGPNRAFSNGSEPSEPVSSETR